MGNDPPQKKKIPTASSSKSLGLWHVAPHLQAHPAFRGAGAGRVHLLRKSQLPIYCIAQAASGRCQGVRGNGACVFAGEAAAARRVAFKRVVEAADEAETINTLG